MRQGWGGLGVEEMISWLPQDSSAIFYPPEALFLGVTGMSMWRKEGISDGDEFSTETSWPPGSRSLKDKEPIMGNRGCIMKGNCKIKSLGRVDSELAQQVTGFAMEACLTNPACSPGPV